MTLLSALATIVVSYAGMTTALFVLSKALPTTATQLRQLSSFAARMMASSAMMCLCATYGALASLVLRCFGLGGLGQWATALSFKWPMWWLTGVWFDVEEDGRQHLDTRPAVFVGNHQTELDILMLAHVFPPYCSITAKSTLKYVPFLGQFMLFSKTVFIDRANHKNAMAAFESAANQIRGERQSVFIFAEGTRSYYDKPDLLPFKKGAFHLALQAGAPIVPVVTANYSTVLSFRKRLFRAGRIPIRILKPVETEGLDSGDVEDLMKKVRHDMLQALVEISTRTRVTEANGTASGMEKKEKEKIAVKS